MKKKYESKPRKHLHLVRPIEGAGPSETDVPDELKLPERERPLPETLEPTSDEFEHPSPKPGKRNVIGNR
jgi:hypothetical protein